VSVYSPRPGGRAVSKFEFSLQTAFKLRQREEDAARQRLAEAHRATQDLLGQLAELQERHDRVEALLRDEARADGEVPLAVFANGRTWLSATRAEMAWLRERLAHAEEIVERRRGELLAASCRKKTLERLSERREAEHMRRERLGEQRLLDEMAAIAGAVKATGGHSGAALLGRPGT